MRKQKILSVALFLVIMIASLSSSLNLMTAGMRCAIGDESMKQPLCDRPCNFDGELSDVGDTLPQGIVDYNLTDYYCGTWCDAEKTKDDTDDDLMCWAAAASNVLEWTGWGFVRDPIEGEMTNCDQIFEHINDHCNDTGGWAIGAWRWWFNGTGSDPPWIVPGGGNFWGPTYNADDFYHTYSGNDTLKYIDEYLSNGWGVAIAVHDGAHEITCWGFTYDDTVNKTTNPRDYYKGVWVTDSDDDKWAYSWTPPPNTIRYYEVFYNETGPFWQFSGPGYAGWHISAVEALEKNPFLEPDLVIYKSAYPDVVMAGEELFYNITVVNANEIVGGVTAYNVVVTDILPDGVTYIADTGGCVLVSGTTYSCSLGDIAPGDSRSFTIKVRVDLDYVVNYGSTITNTASVTSDSRCWESDLRDNEATVTSFVQDDVADVRLAEDNPPYFGKIDSSDPVHTGQSFIYTLYVTNAGPSTAVNVVVKDWVPAGLSINNATCSKVLDGDWNIGVPGDPLRPTTFYLGSMQMGTSESITINVTVLDPADPSLVTWILHNDAVVSSDTFDPDNSNNLATEDTTILNSLVKETADLKVTKIVKPDTTVLAGETINCTIIVENLGSHTALNVSIRDEILSSGIFELVDCILDSNLNDEGPFYPTSPPGGMTLEFNLNEPLAPKNVSIAGRWVIQILLRANETQDINDVVNVFTRDINGFISVDPDLSNNEAQCSIHVTGVADLELTKSDSPDPLPAIAGEGPFILTYTLTVTNHGPSTAVNVLIKDWLPEGLTIEYVTATGTGSCKAGVPGDLSSPTTCAFDSIAPGASENMTIKTVLLSTGLILIKPSNILHNDAMVSSDTLDLDNSNDFATENTRVVEHSYELGTVTNTSGSPGTIGPILLVSLVSIIIAIGIWKKRMLFAGSITKHFTELLKANGKRT